MFLSVLSSVWCLSLSFCLPGTLVAKSLDDIVDAVHGETFGQGDPGNVYLLEAERPVARLTVEMGMQVVHLAVAVAAAEGILQRPRTVVDGVDEVMPEEEGDGAEDGRLVHRHEAVFQVEQGEGAVGSQHLPQHQQAVGSRLDVAQGEQFQIGFFICHGLIAC